MSMKSISTQTLDCLAGTWTGEGRGYFPGVISFDIRTTLTFTLHDAKTLAYEQRAQKLYDGQSEWRESHWESGFLRILDINELELTSAQIGRVEVLTGSVLESDSSLQIHFVSKSIMNDPRMVSSARTFALEDNTLRYTMEMRTTKVDRSTAHLEIVLSRTA